MPDAVDHPVRPFLLRIADYLDRRQSEHDEAWAVMIRGLVAEHDVTSVYGWRKIRHLPSAGGSEERWLAGGIDWDAPHEDCPTACGACSDTSGSDEHMPMPHPCPTLLEVAWVFRHVDGFDPAWLPTKSAIPGELAPPGLPS